MLPAILESQECELKYGENGKLHSCWVLLFGSISPPPPPKKAALKKMMSVQRNMIN